MDHECQMCSGVMTIVLGDGMRHCEHCDRPCGNPNCERTETCLDKKTKREARNQ